MNKIVLGLIGVGALGISAGAHAALSLTVTDGSGNTVTINDDGVGDTFSPGASALNWADNLASIADWKFETVTGYSLAEATPQQMNMIFAATSLKNDSQLTIELTETEFSGFGSAVFELGSANLPGTGSFDLLLNGVSLSGSTLGASGVAAFSDASGQLGLGNPIGNFSLTMRAVLTASAVNQNFSGNTSVNVPEPSILALIGGGLIGFGLVRRKVKK